MLNISSVLLYTVISLAFAWFIILIIAIVTISRRRDMAVPVKIFWAAVIFFAPVVGLILYFVFGFRKSDRDIRRY